MHDWKAVEDKLKDMEAAYASIGNAGLFGARFVIRPLRERFNRGERTERLYREIMDLE